MTSLNTPLPHKYLSASLGYCNDICLIPLPSAFVISSIFRNGFSIFKLLTVIFLISLNVPSPHKYLSTSFGYCKDICLAPLPLPSFIIISSIFNNGFSIFKLLTVIFLISLNVPSPHRYSFTFSLKFKLICLFTSVDPLVDTSSIFIKG